MQPTPSNDKPVIAANDEAAALKELATGAAHINPGTILQEANRLIYGERAQQYGPPKENFKDIANTWTVLLRRKLLPDAQLDPEEIAAMMGALKIIRFINSRDRDSVVDWAGYAGTAERVLWE